MNSGLVPCAVVVDSRNIRGQARKLFGWSRQPSADGVRRALAAYGLDAVEIYVGVATRTASSSPSTRLSQHLRVNGEYRDRLRAEGAEVLEGH